jgi:hypothetical protein
MNVPVFYGWTILVAIPLVIFWMDISTDTAQPLVFFGCVFLAGVGVAAQFKDRGTQKVHG